MKRLFVFLLVGAVMLGACEVPIERGAESTNTDVEVGVVTQFDGCTLYAVRTNRIVYVARCDDTTNTEWQTYDPNTKTTDDHQTTTANAERK